jgi:hypothetical protein
MRDIDAERITRARARCKLPAMFWRALVPFIVWALFLSGCDKPTHENIEKWMNTQKGVGKLVNAFKDEGLDVDLSAHAAAVLVKKGLDPDVRSGFEQMSPGRRTAVVAKLAPRLWELARVEGDLQLPSPNQVRAKDALVLSRKFADDATKQQIDGYLIDWYCVASYESRAATGAVLGSTVIRQIGLPAGKKLIHVGDGVLAANRSAKPGEKQNRIGDELLLAIAVSGDPDGVRFLIQTARDKSDDKTLTARAMSALYKAYVDPGGMFELVASPALVPSIDGITAIAKDENMPADAADDAVRLLRVIGPPSCIAPLVSMVGYPHGNPKFKYVAADSALKCGGTAVIKDVVHALPDGPYRQDELQGGVVVDITMMSPRPVVLAALRDLLNDKGRIARWVAVEGLAAMKSTEDAPKLAAISSGEKLTGFWGDPAKADPTLGQRAKELAAKLK